MKAPLVFGLVLVGACNPTPTAPPASSPPASSSPAGEGGGSPIDRGDVRPSSSASSGVPSSASQPGDEAPKRTGPKGTADIVSLTATPPVSRADHVLLANRARFRSCYQRALESAPTLAGSVTVSAAVSANGEVATVSADPSVKELADVASCVANGVRRMAFDPPFGGSSKLTFTVTFAPAK